MLDIIVDTILDSLKILPFLFVAFYIMEYIEHKFSDKSKELVVKSGRFGPILGAILGAFPQCGFSVATTNFYATRIMTVGTLISIYLSTSDEMLPIMLSHGVEVGTIVKIIGLKVLIGMVCGIVIDFILRKKQKLDEQIHDFCDDEHCGCEHSLLLSTIKHTLNILLFIFITTFILNVVMHYLGEDELRNLFMHDKFFGPILGSLIGLIPNCGASVIITELYLSGNITFGSAMAGLLTGSGVALLVLFKTNKKFKENLYILLCLYLIGVSAGVLLDFLGIVI